MPVKVTAGPTARIARQLAGLILSLLAVSFVIFAVMAAVPGDPAEIMLGTSAAPDTLAALRHQLGLDQPFLMRYADWLFGLLRGDFGTSYTYSTPVGALIAERLVVTLPLAGLAIFLSLLISVPLGVFAAHRPGGPIDLVATFFFPDRHCRSQFLDRASADSGCRPDIRLFSNRRIPRLAGRLLACAQRACSACHPRLPSRRRPY